MEILRKKNIWLGLVLVCVLFFGQAKSAHAISLSINPVSEMNKILNDLGINKSTIQNLGTMVNNMDNKTMPPQVTLTFVPINPKEGEKLTANAMPAHFLNDPSKLYYTWFLKVKDCDKKSSGAGNDEKCNLDGDDDIDIEDYKIKAMRIIANDGFDWENGDYASDNDNDGYEANWGGDDQSGKEDPECFVNNPKTGEDYPIECDEHLFPNASGEETGDDEFEKGEEEFWRTDPHSRDTGHTGKTDEANVCGLGINQFTWNYQKGDKVGVVVEGIGVSPTQENDANYKIMWAMSSKNYETDADIDTGDYIPDPNPADVSASTTTGTSPNTTTTTYTTRTTQEVDEDSDGNLTNAGNIVQINTIISKKAVVVASSRGTVTTSPPVVTTSGTNPGNSDTTVTLSSSTSGPSLVSDDLDVAFADDEELENYNQSHEVWERIESLTPGIEDVDVNETILNENKRRTQVTVVSDGLVPPTYTITTTISTWTDTTTTKVTYDTEKDVPATIVSEDFDIDSEFVYISKTISTETLEQDDFDVDIDGKDIDQVSDLSELLPGALIDPSINAVESEKLKINLVYSPAFPVNDPLTDGEKGDILSLTSSVVNPQNKNSLKYSWEVYRNDSIDEDSWDQIIKSELPEASQTSGLGLNTFQFKLNLPEKYDDDEGMEKTMNFIRIVLRVEEPIGEGKTRRGNEWVIIPIESSSGKIKVSNVSINSGALASGDEICSGDLNNPEEKTICPITKSSIVHLSLEGADVDFEDFLWTVDGKTIAYKTCPLSSCDGSQDEAYFPITKEVGGKHIVNLIATNTAGDKISLTKTFKVVDPTIKIIPTNENSDDNCEKIKIGEYVDMNGVTITDYSKKDLLAVIGSPIKITVDVSGFSLPSDENNFTWSVNGDSFLGQDDLELPAREESGENYAVSVSALYSQNNDLKKALNEYWGISPTDFYEKVISDEVQIIVQSPDCVAEGDEKGKIFASLSSSIPKYLDFLLRIVLMSFLIILVSKVILVFSSETK